MAKKKNYIISYIDKKNFSRQEATIKGLKEAESFANELFINGNHVHFIVPIREDGEKASAIEHIPLQSLIRRWKKRGMQTEQHIKCHEKIDKNINEFIKKFKKKEPELSFGKTYMMVGRKKNAKLLTMIPNGFVDEEKIINTKRLIIVIFLTLIMLCILYTMAYSAITKKNPFSTISSFLK